MPSEKQPDLLWKPSRQAIKNSHLYHYMDWLNEEKQLEFKDYQELWEWSCENIEHFWESLIQYFNVKLHDPYFKILEGKMPACSWFQESKVNYAEHLVRKARHDEIAIYFENEGGLKKEINWETLLREVASVQSFFKDQGLKKGDRVVSYLPNIPEAVVAFIAAASLGAIWSSCSPDFGVSSVIDRFQQIEPKILIGADGYHYNGKKFNRLSELREIAGKLPTLQAVVFINYIGKEKPDGMIDWEDVIMTSGEPTPDFLPVAFDDPLWILYSSGTTGIPKAITQSHGGILLEHLKYMSFHNDVHHGELFFWYTTTGWMMWNYLIGSFLAGATIVLYDGSPAYPDISRLWHMAAVTKINHFGTSAPFLVACMKRDLDLSDLKLDNLRSIGSTGSPLPSEAFQYVYDHIREDVWLCSMAGGTDVCTAFVGGNPLLPVYKGEIQCRALGVNLHAYNESGLRVTGELGEMVIESPMPSMPIYFWNDTDNVRYKASYFEMYPGKWRHGDWISINDRGGLVIYGRSDATLNRHGVRIGTSEIYSSLDKIAELEDALIINLELDGGKDYMPLFVKMKQGQKLNQHIINKINQQLKTDYSPRHVPDTIIEVPDIPYTISGKKMETPIKKILLGMKTEIAANKESMKNPDSLAFFANKRNSLLGIK